MDQETLHKLRFELARARNEEQDASKKRQAAERAYVEAKAESVGVRIGTIVTTTQKEGYGPKQRVVTRRYRVCSIGLSTYRKHELTLLGITIRKDGSDGEKHEIWHDWEIEQ